ncbi:MAG: M23 family metallopeptidase [Chloroflexi bacterium]|nr:MAG: M23 family metallopeptidase [Chloroflexota bacterium]
MHHRKLLLIVWILVFFSLFYFSKERLVSAGLPELQDRPFGLPFAEPPGPDTWLLVQPYGNTVSAFYQRSSTYQAGQGLHFGIDLASRCGFPIVAIGDGIVAKVDAKEHGSAPHNLMIDHPNGYASFYGHLYETPNLSPGQQVHRGEVIAMVGDPDESCTSRPHLHLEIRNAGAYNRAYNPINLIEADWDTLALTGSSGFSFAQDLNEPHRWQTLRDQPEVQFWGPLANDYANPWPLEWDR